MTKNTEKNANKNLFNTEIRAKGVLPFPFFVCGCSGRKITCIYLYSHLVLL